MLPGVAWEVEHLEPTVADVDVVVLVEGAGYRHTPGLEGVDVEPGVRQAVSIASLSTTGCSCAVRPAALGADPQAGVRAAGGVGDPKAAAQIDHFRHFRQWSVATFSRPRRASNRGRKCRGLDEH